MKTARNPFDLRNSQPGNPSWLGILNIFSRFFIVDPRRKRAPSGLKGICFFQSKGHSCFLGRALLLPVLHKNLDKGS